MKIFFGFKNNKKKQKMHNPLIVISIAAYVTLIHLGMLVGMSVIHKSSSNDSEKRKIRKRRSIAALVAYIIALIVALGFAFMRQEKAKTHLTYWATIFILFFGVSYAIYSIIPKVYAEDPTAEDQKTKMTLGRVANIVHAMALIGALLTYVTARFTMTPLASSK